MAVGAGSSVDRDAVLELLADLVARSLVVAERASTTTRFRLLETIREYAEERLGDYGEVDALRDQHAEYFATRGIEMARATYGPDQLVATEWLDTERDNLGIAIALATDHGDVDQALRLLDAVADTGMIGFPFTFNMESVLELRGAAEHPLYAAALAASALAAIQRADPDRARELVAAANRSGGEDNITVVFFEVVADGAEAPSQTKPMPALELAPPPKLDEDTLTELDRVPAIDTMVVPPDRARVLGAGASMGPSIPGTVTEEEREPKPHLGVQAARLIIALGVIVGLLLLVYWLFGQSQ